MKALDACYYLETGVDGRPLNGDVIAAAGVRLTHVGTGSGLFVWEHPEGLSLTWPVRVFRVVDIDQIGLGSATRSQGVVHICRALTVVDGIPARSIFGANGESVARLVAQAETIDETSVWRFAPPSADMEKAWLRTHNEMVARRDGGTSSASVIVSAAVTAAAKRSRLPAFETREVLDPEFGPYVAEVLVDRWEAARMTAWYSAYGFAAKPLISDERFQMLTGTWVTAMGDPSTHDADLPLPRWSDLREASRASRNLPVRPPRCGTTVCEAGHRNYHRYHMPPVTHQDVLCAKDGSKARHGTVVTLMLST